MTHATSSLPQQQSAPATATPSASAASMITATENFITFLDALKLGIGSKDQLHPLLSEVIQSANKVTDTQFEGRGNIIKWLIRLNNMKAHEELSEDDKREIEFEMDGAYRGFKSVMT
jgi:ESCRT-I complex subunit VPS28